jgi:hypothetical protein
VVAAGVEAVFACRRFYDAPLFFLAPVLPCLRRQPLHHTEAVFGDVAHENFGVTHCAAHPGPVGRLEYFCQQCAVPVCNACYATSHVGHARVTLVDAAAAAREVIAAHLPQLTAGAEQHKAAAAELQRRLELLGANLEAARLRLASHRDALLAQVTTEHDSLTRELAIAYDAKATQLGFALRHAHCCVADLATALECGLVALKSPEDPGLALHVRRTVERRRAMADSRANPTTDVTLEVSPSWPVDPRFGGVITVRRLVVRV